MGKSKRILNSLTLSSTICKFEKNKQDHKKKHPKTKSYKNTEIKYTKKKNKKYPKEIGKCTK